MTKQLVHFGKNKAGQNIALPLNEFTKHCSVFGQTGSGKTGLTVGLTEQFLALGVPCLVVDIKGDMCNIALQPDPMVRARMNLRVLTPGGLHGEPINLFANLQEPFRTRTAVTQILKMVGEKKINPLVSKAHTFLSLALNQLHKQRQPADLVSLIHMLMDPPFVTIGALPLEDFFPSRSRAALAAKLNTMLAAPSFEQWRQGVSLNIEECFEQHKDGTTNLTVYSVRHLDGAEREFALALLFDAVRAWMSNQPGTKDLRAAMLIDECAGLMPAMRAPQTKSPLLTMLKEARAHGLGLTLATQNPMDLDYKGMSNCGTWLVGTLRMANDRARVLEAVCATTPHSKKRLESQISNLEKRQFVVCRTASTAEFTSRDVNADLIGPMTPMEIKEILRTYEDLDLESFLDI